MLVPILYLLGSVVLATALFVLVSRTFEQQRAKLWMAVVQLARRENLTNGVLTEEFAWFVKQMKNGTEVWTSGGRPIFDPAEASAALHTLGRLQYQPPSGRTRTLLRLRLGGGPNRSSLWSEPLEAEVGR
jgi:hypothetical protein